MRKKKHKIIFLGVLSLLCICFACTRVEAQDIDFLSKLSDLSIFTNRLIFDWPEVRLFLIDERKNLDPAMPAVGFSSPFVSFGPVYKAGFLREASNPLGYSPGSDVFTERTTISPDISCDASKLSFVLVSLLPGIVSLYTVWENSILRHAGGIVTIPFSDKSFFDLIFSTSAPRDPVTQDTWYIDKNTYSGGIVYNTGARAAFITGPIVIHSSILLSGNDYFDPGLFTLIGIKVLLDNVQFEALFGYCTDSYLTPDCFFIEKEYQGEAVFSFAPITSVECELGMGIDLDRPLLRPKIFTSGTENCSAKVDASFPLNTDSAIGFRTNTYYETEFETDGSDTKNLNLGFSITGNAGPLEGEAGIDSHVSDFEFKTAEAKCSLSFDFPSHSIKVSCSTNLFPELGVSGKLSYKYTFGLSQCIITLSSKKPYEPKANSWSGFAAQPFDYLLLTIGFETKKKHTL